MKSLEEIQNMLVCEFNSCKWEEIVHEHVQYYNGFMGDVSFLLSQILELELKEKVIDWDSQKWIDDSLLSKVVREGSNIRIWGVMIWGRHDTTKQWTDPFFFKIELAESADTFHGYTFLFCEEGSREISYEDFNFERGMWDESFYSTKDWDPSERKWKYIIFYDNTTSAATK
jgi:hypothetical protein